MNTRFDISAWASRALEWCWLCTILIIPSYFNLLSARHFEPDKAILLRAIATVMLALAAAGWVARRAQHTPSRLRTTLPDMPLTYSVVAYVVIFLFATATSIVPTVSFWGSYQRLQGTYTNIAYIAIALIIVTHLRTREQLWRLLGAVVLSGLIPTLYGVVQHFETDPLPWKGDVITRVASTMGNSIFIAAFLILILPCTVAAAFLCLKAARTQQSEQTSELFPVIAALLSSLGSVCLVFCAIQFSGVIRTVDLRFWWVYPGALLFASIALVVQLFRHTEKHHDHSVSRSTTLIPALLTSSYALMLVFAGQTSTDVRAVFPTDGRFGANWVWWLIAAVVFHWAPLFAHAFPAHIVRTRTVLLTAAGLLFAGSIAASVTIVFTQSRGPWIGGAVGMVFFCTVVLVELMRDGGRYRNLARRLLIAEGATVVVLTAVLLLFNFSQHPVFEQLRDVPYIGRMGKLFDVSRGTTGEVRMKIWFGDTYGKGAIGLISADPVRTVIGWGPESMFVAYNRFYPPSLAHIESRSASPDRAHEAFLDEIINKGLLGLISYLALIVTAIAYGFRQLRHQHSTTYRYVSIAAMSVIVAHVTEGLTGIPVVSTLLLLWVAIGMLLSVGVLLSLEEEPVRLPAAEIPATPQLTAKQTGRRRGAPTGRPVSALPAIPGWVPVSAVGLIGAGLILAWTLNLDNAYADMRFQQGTSYAEAGTSTGNTDQQIIALDYFLDAIRMEPNQDYYYLSAGRSLLTLADAKRRMGGNTMSANPATMRDILAQATALDLKDFLATRATTDIVQLAADFLLQAHDINPYNKDHFANLARLYTFWYTRVSQAPQIEEQIFRWYEAGIDNAPNDVSILNEYVSALVARANRIAATDPTTAAALRTQAHTALERSLLLDPTYADTQIRVADLAYADGDYEKALPLYAEILQRDPHALDSQITTIADQLQRTPAVLTRLRDAYLQTAYENDRILLSIIGLLSSRLKDYPAAIAAFGQLVTLQPDSIEALQNYTIVLSNGLQYQDAAIQADRLVELANTQQLPAETVSVYEQLAAFFRAQP